MAFWLATKGILGGSYGLATKGIIYRLPFIEVEFEEEYILPGGGGAPILKKRYIIIRININNKKIERRYEISGKLASVVMRLLSKLTTNIKVTSKVESVSEVKVTNIEVKQL